MNASNWCFCAGFLLTASIVPLTGCDQRDSTASETPDFTSVSEETPDCCMPGDGVVDRTAAEDAGDESAEACCEEPAQDAACCDVPAELVEDSGEAIITLPANPAELVAKVGSIQTSVDPGVIGTIIGRRPYLDLNFKNEDGDEVNLARDYAGKTIVLTTIFTSCPTPTACPRITDDFADLASRLPAELADQVRLVMVSFDPKNDTPEVLKIFGRKHGIDFDRVDLLVSDVATTKRLMLDELEIPIQLDLDTGGFSNHALMVHVINGEGLIVVERTASSSAKISMLLDEVIRAATLPFTAPDNEG